MKVVLEISKTRWDTQYKLNTTQYKQYTGQAGALQGAPDEAKHNKVVGDSFHRDRRTAEWSKHAMPAEENSGVYN